MLEVFKEKRVKLPFYSDQS